MRQIDEKQLPLAPLWPDHQLSEELRAISKILDETPQISSLVLQDLCDTVSPRARRLGDEWRTSPALCGPQADYAMQLRATGFSSGRLHQLSAFLSPALRCGSWPFDPAGEYLPDSVLDLASHPPAVGRLGARERTGEGTQGSDRRYRCGNRYPLSSRQPVAL